MTSGRVRLHSGRITASRGKRKKDKLIRYLEHGWVKESTKNLKYYESIPKKIGMACVISVLERDTKVAKEALVDYELINRV